MKLILSFIFLLTFTVAHSQKTLVPAVGLFQHKWITNDSYQLEMFRANEDDSLEKLADVKINITVSKADVVASASVKTKNGTLIDSTIGDRTTLQPIYRSSYNRELDMSLNFGPVITGYYNDKIREKNINVRDTTTGKSYFDFNMYPYLLGWLPLEENYTADIAVYNYDPAIPSNVGKASIISVKSGKYNTKKSDTREVWVVQVTDQVYGGMNIYYFDKADRRLWKQETDFGNIRIIMLRVE